MRRQLTGALLTALLLFAGSAGSAFAHAQLQKAEPAVGSTVSTSPSEIKLKFSEAVEPHFSAITLQAEGGAAEPLGKAAVAPGDDTTLVAPVTAVLKPGVYTVTWHVVSVDTHKTQGTFQFTVKP
jgi:methionine-rich copper-binding protein CopC